MFGSGKTLNLIVAAVQACVHGRDVYANFRLKPSFVENYPEAATHFHYLEDFLGFLQQREQESLLNPVAEFRDLFLVDEAQAVWNSRTSMMSVQILLTNYIFISRKLGLELRMSTQLASNLDKRAKLEVQLWIVCTKLVHQGRYYFQYQYYHPEAGDIKTTYLTPDAAERYYPYYETTASSNTQIMPMAPMGPMGSVGGGEEPSGRAVPLTFFNQFKRKSDAQNRELWRELRNIKKLVKAKVKAKVKVIQKSDKKKKGGKMRNVRVREK
jgi:hypothetical protein